MTDICVPIYTYSISCGSVHDVHDVHDDVHANVHDVWDNVHDDVHDNVHNVHANDMIYTMM